jgi:hypothetical protein
MQTPKIKLPEGLAVSGRPPPGTNVLDFLAISFCNSLPFLLLKSELASALSCHGKEMSESESDLTCLRICQLSGLKINPREA